MNGVVVDAQEDLAEAVVRFVHAFGLHRPDRTPCGFDATVAEAHALIELDNGVLRQTVLVDRLGLTKGSVSRLVTSLAARGWLERRSAADDGRGVDLELTAAGKAAVERLRRARAQRLARLLEAVPPRKRAATIDALEVLAAAAAATSTPVETP